MTDTTVEITPRGIRRSGRTLLTGLHQAGRQLRQVMEVVRLNLQVENFGTVLGKSWLIFDPLLQAALYFFLIKVILGVRGSDVSLVFIFTAVTFWRSHQTLVVASSNLIRSRGLFFLQVNLPLQVAYYEFIGAELALCLLRFAALLAFIVLFSNPPLWSWLFVPFIIVAQFSFTTAVVIWLSIFGTFIRDLARVLPVVVAVWWYLSPGLYSIGRVPAPLRLIYDANPFAYIFGGYKSALIEGTITYAGELTLLTIGSVLASIAGAYALRRSRYFFFRHL